MTIQQILNLLRVRISLKGDLNRPNILISIFGILSALCGLASVFFYIGLKNEAQTCENGSDKAKSLDGTNINGIKQLNTGAK